MLRISFTESRINVTIYLEYLYNNLKKKNQYMILVYRIIIINSQIITF